MLRARILMIVWCLLALPMAANAQTADPPRAGVDYEVIAQGKPWQPLAGKIEVAEVFAYWCDHCARFQPALDIWRRTLPKDVRVTYVPAAFDLDDAYARAFFAAESSGALGKTHDAMFRAVHETQSLPRNGATIDEVAGFYPAYGIAAGKMAAAMRSPAVDAKMQRARQFAVDAGVPGTPTLIVNGKYRVTGDTHQDTLRIAQALIAMERAAARKPR